MPRMFTDNDGQDWVRATDVEPAYETYVKYIVVRRMGTLEDAFEELEHQVNKFIEDASDSFVTDGTVQITDSHVIQTLMNEDEM